jgi:hypothetical protein
MTLWTRFRVPTRVLAQGPRATDLTLKSVTEKCGWIRAAAGDRWADLEINMLLVDVIATSDRRAAAEAYIDTLRHSPFFVSDGDVSTDDLLTSPYLAFGTEEQITEHIVRIREETGASYFVVGAWSMDTFAPTISRLTHRPTRS